MQTSAPTRLECLMLADDLTGACDSAVHFAVRGHRTAACFDAAVDPAGLDVLAISTDTRDAPPEEFERLANETARRFAGREPRFVIKKIDSLLRGNPGGEIRAAAEAFGCDTALATPAFPVMKRHVERGRLQVPGIAGFEPIDVPGRLREQGMTDCVQTVPSELLRAIESGSRFLSLDAVCDEDLDAIVAGALESGRKVLWAGSGGLACALARAIAPSCTGGKSAPVLHRTPVLFCLGSDHAVTIEQQRRLLETRPSVLLNAETAEAAEVRTALERGVHVVLRIPRGRVEPDRLCALAAGAGALLISGGDTATAVCRALGTSRIDLNEEVIPGIPCGLFCGGRLHGTPVATKSGAFGGPDALVDVADYFTWK